MKTMACFSSAGVPAAVAGFSDDVLSREQILGEDGSNRGESQPSAKRAIIVVPFYHTTEYEVSFPQHETSDSSTGDQTWIREQNTDSLVSQSKKSNKIVSCLPLPYRIMFLANAIKGKIKGKKSRQPPSADIYMKSDQHLLVDLKLDTRLEPTSIAEYKKENAPHSSSSQQLANRLRDTLHTCKTYAIGSGLADDHVYYPGDLGLFGCIFEAWKHHWVLRASPEDWWGPIACKIAKSIDKAAKGTHKSAQQVRDLFVSHQGKEQIAVPLNCFTIYDANYDFLVSGISSQIEDKIKVPEYAQAMQNDFTSSGAVHKISSLINLMASMQEFFEYSMVCCGCGLRGLEMAGTVEDWERLVAKLKQVRLTLEPIKNQIGLYDSWWDRVQDVFENLANTRRNPEDPAVAKFWINILCETTDTKYVGGGPSMPGRPVEVEAYDGWLISFLTDRAKIRAEDLGFGGDKRLKQQLSGWNSVPMKVELTWCNPPLEDQAELIAGIVGFKVHEGEGHHGEQDSEEKKDGDQVPSVEPNHMWAMLLPPRSKLRGDASKKNFIYDI